MESVLAETISIAQFCQLFEKIYNFELDTSTLSANEVSSLSELFDAVVWFSPYPEERLQIPHYLGEAEIIEAVKRAMGRCQDPPAMAMT